MTNWIGLLLGWIGMWATIGEAFGFTRLFLSLMLFTHAAILFLYCLCRFDPPAVPDIPDDEWPNTLPIDERIRA